jgi:ribosomal protein S18 acetylase RimI-like enzyme
MKSIRDLYSLVTLAKEHDRSAFICGQTPLDRYFKEQSFQDVKRTVATVFVAVETTTCEIHGFYTLSMAGVSLDLLPKELAGKMPKYPSIPAVRLGRLAVHRKAQKRGLGVHMLMDSMARSLQNEIAWTAFIVDAKDDDSAGFYKKYGFLSFADCPGHLYIMRKTIEPLFASKAVF